MKLLVSLLLALLLSSPAGAQTISTGVVQSVNLGSYVGPTIAVEATVGGLTTSSTIDLAQKLHEPGMSMVVIVETIYTNSHLISGLRFNKRFGSWSKSSQQVILGMAYKNWTIDFRKTFKETATNDSRTIEVRWSKNQGKISYKIEDGFTWYHQGAEKRLGWFQTISVGYIVH